MSLEDLSYEARDELALLARQLAENPKTRKAFLRLTKEAKPDMPIPELEIEIVDPEEVTIGMDGVEITLTPGEDDGEEGFSDNLAEYIKSSALQSLAGAGTDSQGVTGL